MLDPAAGPVAHARFAQERAVHARLMLPPAAPHVIPLHPVQPEGWLVMHWAPGGTLADTLERAASLDRAFVERTLVALGEAVEGLAARGVMHRDLKPSNILLDGARVWLADFGLAATRQADGGWRALPEPWVETEIGTPEWRAPELAEVPPRTTERVDRYALERLREVMVGLVGAPEL
jgi:serine/threonine protein kinase